MAANQISYLLKEEKKSLNNKYKKHKDLKLELITLGCAIGEI